MTGDAKEVVQKLDHQGVRVPGCRGRKGPRAEVVEQCQQVLSRGPNETYVVTMGCGDAESCPRWLSRSPE